MNERVVVLIDGDNISAALASKILEISANLGQLRVIRVYTDATRLSGWHEAHGFGLIHAGTGKNASDLMLAIDAIQLALEGDFTSFVIASSDGDFTHLALRLRELGQMVTGIGERKAPLPFSHACNEFTEIEHSKKTLDLAKGNIITATELDLCIRKTIAADSEKGEGIAITDLSLKMYAKFGIKISTHQERTWRAYLKARATLYELDPRGPNAKVRFINSGFE